MNILELLTEETKNVILEMIEKDIIKVEDLGNDVDYLSTLAFQYKFKHGFSTMPTPLMPNDGVKRMNYIGEEIIEYLHACAQGEKNLFIELVESFLLALEKATKKQLDEGEYEDKSALYTLLRQYDALIDIKYFLSGTFNLQGIQPYEGFNAVQNANMKKLGPDGEPILREGDGKIMKPEGWEQFAPEPKLLEILKSKINKGL